ncbi:MAG: Lrp/AsnC family transcriptional regulator, partial [Pseudomonadota bacterium]|nr:Lrp/AsnC family transcriptional regulator [Pseudomonadota bacterium]
MDKTDFSILSLLQDDGKLSNAKLAEKLNLSETPCWRRVKRLEAEGYIDSYQANLNKRKLGFGVMAFVQLTYTAHDNKTTENFEALIAGCDNV